MPHKLLKDFSDFFSDYIYDGNNKCITNGEHVDGLKTRKSALYTKKIVDKRKVNTGL